MLAFPDHFGMGLKAGPPPPPANPATLAVTVNNPCDDQRPELSTFSFEGYSHCSHRLSWRPDPLDSSHSSSWPCNASLYVARFSGEDNGFLRVAVRASVPVSGSWSRFRSREGECKTTQPSPNRISGGRLREPVLLRVPMIRTMAS